MAEDATMRRLVVHIGQHKTGSTAIQKTLLNNREKLAGRGIVYPEIGLVGAGQHKIPGALGNVARKAEAAGYFRQLADLDGTVVISSENFSRASPAAIAALPALIGAGTAVTIILYIRNFLDVPYAWWQEQVKHGLKTAFPAYLAELLIKPYRNHMLGVTQTIRRYADAFGRSALRIYLYEAASAAGDGDVSVQFMRDVLGVTDQEREPGLETINKSHDVASAELIRLLNCLGAHGDEVLRTNAAAQALCARIRLAGAPYTRSIALDYEAATFRRLERDLIAAWGPLVLPTRAPGETELFAERSREVGYLDPVMWVKEEGLAGELRRLAGT